jgi:hypothetical protein
MNQGESGLPVAGSEAGRDRSVGLSVVRCTQIAACVQQRFDRLAVRRACSTALSRARPTALQQ